MHFSSIRKRLTWLLAIVAVLSLVTTTLITDFSPHGAKAAPIARSVVYHATPGTITRLSTTLPGSKPPVTVQPSQRTLTLPDTATVHMASTRLAAVGPATSNTSLSISTRGLLENFQGLDDTDQANVNGGIVEGSTAPPDQGLAVGVDPRVPGKTVVFEAVNTALRETATDGSVLPQASLLGGHDVSFGNFWEPGAFTDPRVFYDASTQSFYFTAIGIFQGAPVKETSVDLAVYNAHGFAVYQIDSSLGDQYLGDQPRVGYDNNNLYVSVDGYHTGGENPLAGSLLFAIPKTQLIDEAVSLNESIFGPVSLGGIPTLTLQPAISTSSTNTEYLVNSFPYTDAILTPNAISHQLGFWKVTGFFTNATLSGRIIQSETYTFTVDAASTGSGVTDSNGITSLALVSANERLGQVQYIDGDIWTTLGTAISLDDDPIARDGVAWFEIDAATGEVSSQGYVASQGRYLLDPVIWHNAKGTTTLVFTMTSTTLNPSAAYVVREAGSNHFGPIMLASEGSSAHMSFLNELGHGRWGDYSAACFAPNGKDIWLATEYIPDAAHQDPRDNWGTRVFEVNGG